MSDKVKKKKLKYDNKTLLVPQWFESVKQFEFITLFSLDDCIASLAKEWVTSPTGFWENHFVRVGIQRHGDSFASFRIETTRHRSTSALQGVIEVLNDGSTAVRGEFIREFDHETLFSLIGLTVWIFLIPHPLNGLPLNGLFVVFAIAAIWFRRWGKSQHPNVKYLESLMGYTGN